MKIKYENKKIMIDRKIILLIYFVIVIVSKILRYTVMKQTLVDTARGYQIVNDILYNSDLHFAFSDINSSLAFNNAAVIFKIINIFGLTTYIQFEIYITIVWNMIVILIISNIDKLKSNSEGVFIISTIAILNIFNFTISKEPIQLLYFLLMYLFLISKIRAKSKFWFCIFVILISVLTYRSYYILFAFFSCVLYIIFSIFKKKERIKVKHIIIILFFIYITYVLFLYASNVFFPGAYSELLWLKSHTELSPAATQIYNVLNNPTTNNFKLALEYVILMIRLLVPYEIAFKGPKYLLFVLYQLMISFYLIKCIINYKKNDEITNYSLLLFIGFLLASVTFEPDYGSWVRHESVAFPLLLLIIGIKNKKYKENNEVRI